MIRKYNTRDGWVAYTLDFERECYVAVNNLGEELFFDSFETNVRRFCEELAAA